MGGSSFFIIAGIPATIQLSGMSFVTTAPAATITFEPILILGKIVAFEPIVVKLPILQFPRILAPGDISTNFPIIES